jgi:16S rRNA (adenine1518-N6/adenine1519-N6)-dimethyltransferase
VADPGGLPPLGPSAALRAIDRKPVRRLSQSFLRDGSIARAMVAAAELTLADTALEIGPGLGMLTRELLAAAGSVVVIELDRTLAEALPSTLGNPPTLSVVHGDALSTPFDGLVDEPYITVASLPYHVATPILFRLLLQPPRPTRIVAMVQLEVAQRIVAGPGSWTYLGAAVHLVAEPRIVRRVSPGSFFPVPKVWSAVLRLDVLPQARVAVESVDAFLELLRAGFTQPRKQLHNSLAQGLGIAPDAAHAAIDRTGLDPSLRPGVLSLTDWARVFDAVRELQA